MLKLAARLLLIAVVFAILYQGVPRVLALGVDGDGLSLARHLLQEARRHQALQLRNQEMIESRDRKTAVIEEYIAGNLTLAEGIERFHAAVRLIENDRQGLVAPYLAPETRAELCAQFRVWVKMVLRANYKPHEAELVTCRLEEELNEQFPMQEIGQYPDITRAQAALVPMR